MSNHIYEEIISNGTKFIYGMRIIIEKNPVSHSLLGKPIIYYEYLKKLFYINII